MSLTSTFISLIHFPISHLFLPKNNCACSFIFITLLTCYCIMCLSVHEANKLGSGVKTTSPRVGCTVWCAWCLLKPMVWMCLLDGWSHRDSPTEAKSTHTDEDSSQCDIAFIHTISISCEKADSCKRLFALRLSSSSYHTHTHTPHAYLFIIFMHTYTYSEDSPQDS